MLHLLLLCNERGHHLAAARVQNGRTSRRSATLTSFCRTRAPRCVWTTGGSASVQKLPNLQSAEAAGAGAGAGVVSVSGGAWHMNDGESALYAPCTRPTAGRDAGRDLSQGSTRAEGQRIHSMQLLVLKFLYASSASSAPSDELDAARRHFSQLYARLFGEQPPARSGTRRGAPASATASVLASAPADDVRLLDGGLKSGMFLFGHATVDMQDVVDVVLLVAANFALDAAAYGCVYWAVFTLLSVRRTNGRRLADAMEARGFVFDTDFKATAAEIRAHVRAPTVWESIQTYVEQLCELLVQPEHVTLAGVYNDIVRRCDLPVPAVSALSGPPCRLAALRKLVRHFYQDPRYTAALKHYVRVYAQGKDAAATSKVTLNGTDTGARLARALRTRVPVFASAASCATFALNCAEDTFLAAGERRDASWYLRAYHVPEHHERHPPDAASQLSVKSEPTRIPTQVLM